MTTRALDPAGGSRFPWKSLNERIWTLIVGPLGAAWEVPPVITTPVAPASTAARTPVTRRVRDMDMRLLLIWVAGKGLSPRGLTVAPSGQSRTNPPEKGDMAAQEGGHLAPAARAG